MATLRYDIDVDTRRAEARIGAFALTMRRQITQAVRSLPEIQIDANSTDAQREIAQVRRELVELGNQRIGIDISATDADRKLTELKARLQALQGTADIQVDADVTAALEALGVVDAAVTRLDGRKATVKVDADKSLAETIIQVNLLGRALAAIALPAAAINMIPTIGAIASSLSDLAGAAGLIPAITLEAAATFGTLAIGLAHVSDALGPTGTAAQLKKVDEALAALPPDARATVQAIRDLGPAWTDVRLDVQTKLFAGMRTEIEGLAKTELPVLRAGLTGVATELNLSARSFLDWVRSAQTTADVKTIFIGTRDTLHELIPVAANVSAAFLDIGAVGAQFLPRLAAGFTDMTARVREFVDNARQTGQLQEWIQTGITKVEQLGRVLGNVGDAVVSFFKAAMTTGGDFLDVAEKVSAELDRFIHTPVAQTGIVAIFSQISDTIDRALPGLEQFIEKIGEAAAAAANTNGLRQAGAAISDLAAAVAPLIPQLAQLAGDTLHGLATTAMGVAVALGPIVQGLGAIIEKAGPVGPAILAMVVAFKLLSPLSGIVTGLGTSLAGMATTAGASEAAAARIATTFSRVGTAIPLLGVAIIGLGVLYDALRDKTDETAAAVLRGSEDFAVAVDAQTKKIDEQNAAMDRQIARGFGTGQAMQKAAESTREAGAATDAHTTAVNQLVASMTQQADSMSGVEQAQARLKIAQLEWNEAVRAFGPDSDQAAAAAGNLATASFNLKTAQDAAAAATKTLGDEIVQTSQASSAAANADVAYQQAVINVAAANENATKVAHTRGVTESELAAANLQVVQANLAAADAARRKAEADATATGASNVAQIGAQAYKEELLRLASTASGPVRDALIAQANGTDLAARASNTAEIAARAQKDELGKLADQATGPLAAAMHTATANFDTLGGAHATAEQRAKAQKDELLRLADMASGPVKASLLAMADQVSHLPNGSFTVTATGVSAYKFSSTGEVLGSGNTGLARGGVWGGPGSHRYMADSGVMPGNTPGRDVHHFFSPTAGGLHLSGGEAVMRPEWTAAISGIHGRKYISEANSAARRGGVQGVMSFLAHTGENAAGGQAPKGRTRKFANGGIIGGDQHLALGGWINAGKPFNQLVPDAFQTDAAEVRRVLIAEIQAKLRAHEAAAKAAIARAAAAAAAALGSGGGSAVAGGPVWDVIQRTAGQFGWGGGAEYAALQWIIMHESGGRPNAQNPTSTAYGLFQFLNGTWASTGIGKTSDPALQALAGMRYISSRYGDPIAAQRFWQAHGWYGGGGVLPAQLADSGAMLPHGSAAINLSGMPERVLSPDETRSYSANGSVLVVNEVAALRSDVRQLGDAIRSNQGHTFNLHGQDVQESAHASRMLVRTLR